MKRATLLLILSAAGIALSETDDNNETVKASFTCIKSGSKCDGDFLINGAEYCNQDGKRCCMMPLYCVDGTCATNNVGTSCTSDDDCLATFYGTGLSVCDNDTKKCRTVYNAGDTCDSTSACYGGMTCSGSKCVGFEENHECSTLISGTEMSGLTGYVCGKGLYCNDGNCTKKVGDGEDCFGDDACINGYVCNNYKCVKRYSVADNEECDNNNACGLKSVCYEGKCTKGVEYNRMTCNDDSDCVIGDVMGVCQTDPEIFSGKKMCIFHNGLSISCRKKEKRLYRCMEKNGCSPTPSSDGNTCAQTKCSAKILDVFGCVEYCKRFRQTYGSKCATGTILNYCPSVPTWLKIFLVFFVLLVVITILFIIYAVHIHKTKNMAYSEIASASSPAVGSK